MRRVLSADARGGEGCFEIGALYFFESRAARDENVARAAGAVADDDAISFT
jgi:hypothetical protein